MKGDGLRLGLNCGTTFPCISFRTYSIPHDKSITEATIVNALKVGYRHFDTEMVYGSESAVGRALKEAMREGKVEREETFVTSKLWGCDFQDPVPSLRQSLQRLEMEYRDMYLVHWPLKLKPWVHTTFPKEDDLSNVRRRLGGHAPLRRQRKLGEACQENNIHVSAYSDLGGLGNAWGTTAVVEHPAIKSIALKHNVTPAQVALQWGISTGASVTMKSFEEKRMEENFAALDPKLEDRDLSKIDGMQDRKVIRAGIYVGRATGPYETLEDLWDSEM